MTNKENFDVLTIAANRADLDIIQALMGNYCLGVFFRHDSAKLYFNRGLREKMNRILNDPHNVVLSIPIHLVFSYLKYVYP